jgi:hypothetical protein
MKSKEELSCSAAGRGEWAHSHEIGGDVYMYDESYQPVLPLLPRRLLPLPLRCPLPPPNLLHLHRFRFAPKDARQAAIGGVTKETWVRDKKRLEPLKRRKQGGIAEQ